MVAILTQKVRRVAADSESWPIHMMVDHGSARCSGCWYQISKITYIKDYFMDDWREF